MTVETQRRTKTAEAPGPRATSASGADAPPRRPPSLAPVLQVGLIGHRKLTSGDIEGLRTPVSTLLAAIRAAAEAAVERNAGAQPVQLRAVCALAEGADGLLAGSALDLGYRLAVPLPFRREDYRDDFPTPSAKSRFDELLSQAETVYELDGKRAGAEAYQSLGRLLLEQSDIVVAIWNGQPERGPGGTGQILHEAWLADIPTIVIASQAPHGIRCFDPQAEEGTVGIEQIVSRMLTYAPSDGDTNDLSLFLAENLSRGGLSRSTRHATPLAPAREAGGGAQAREGSSAVAAVTAQVDAVLAPHFEAADRLAVRYAKLYRLSGRLRYLIGLPTILGELLAFYGPPNLSRIGFLIVLITTGSMLAIYAIDRTQQWHRRFLDYRFLAEHLRASRVMALLGSTVALPRLPSDRAGDPADWVAFRLRGAIRALGLVQARADAAYLGAVRDAVAAEIRSQLTFYEQRAKRFGSFASWLQRLGLSLYVLGLGFTVIRYSMAVAAYSGDLYNLTAELALVLPALGPIFFGLRSQSEYNRLSQRYASMAKELHRMQNALVSDDVRRNRVERLAREMVHVLLAEVSDWRVLIRARDVAPF